MTAVFYASFALVNLLEKTIEDKDDAFLAELKKAHLFKNHVEQLRKIKAEGPVTFQKICEQERLLNFCLSYFLSMHSDSIFSMADGLKITEVSQRIAVTALQFTELELSEEEFSTQLNAMSIAATKIISSETLEKVKLTLDAIEKGGINGMPSGEYMLRVIEVQEEGSLRIFSFGLKRNKSMSFLAASVKFPKKAFLDYCQNMFSE
jgi:hypothetical protein